MPRSILDHVDFTVTDLARSREFYVRALAPLNIAPIIDFKREDGRRLTGFGTPGYAQFWIREGQPTTGRMHVAFAAESRSAVDAFHQAALAGGARDHGPPGLRPRYHEHWYAAYVLDPDNHIIEAVCHLPG